METTCKLDTRMQTIFDQDERVTRVMVVDEEGLVIAEKPESEPGVSKLVSEISKIAGQGVVVIKSNQVKARLFQDKSNTILITQTQPEWEH